MMTPNERPLIVQSDRTVLLDVHAPRAEDARRAILPFAELEKSPEHIHTYKITPLSLWNAAAAGFSAAAITDALQTYSRYELPAGLLTRFSETLSRFGMITLREMPPEDAGEQARDERASQKTLLLRVEDAAVRAEIDSLKSLKKYLRPAQGGFALSAIHRGTVKWEMIKALWPVQDEAPLSEGAFLELSLREGAGRSGKEWALREYQKEAVNAVFGQGGAATAPGLGFGVVALPCGAGKTIAGMAAMARLKTNTLILTTNITAARQWRDELLDKTTLEAGQIGEYSGAVKTIAPVTIATYQIITWRPSKSDVFPHFELFRARPWGLIIYDEAHLLPAPVFRITAELQSVRRLGLTATLIREDNEEDSVFCLVGPKRYDVPWKELEHKGWIAQALCTEIRLDMPDDLKITYATATVREKYRVASENPAKRGVTLDLVRKHSGGHIIVIGQYIEQLEALAYELEAPLITGKTSNAKREAIYADFRKGVFPVIVVSKVANFAVDLPDASVAIQVSGSFGSRQEEAQRLGRILRPKKQTSFFYTLVSRRTVEEEFSANRQKFLAEQGYSYTITEAPRASGEC